MSLNSNKLGSRSSNRVEPQPMFPTKGISGRRFLILGFVACLLMVMVGIYLTDQTWTQVSNNFLAFIGQYAVNLIAWMIIVALLTPVIFYYVFDLSVRELPNLINDHRSLSYVWILVGILLVAAILAGASRGSTISAYAGFILFKGGFSLMFCSLITAALARLIQLKSMDDCRDWVADPDNHNYTLLIVVIFSLVVLLAMLT